jgi:hypothetical protein
MWKRIIGVLVVCILGWGFYDAYKAGWHTRPLMPEGAFSLSYKSGFRAILVDIPNEKATRRYLGHPADVPFYLEEAWSYCSPPSAAYLADFNKSQNLGPGQRLEALCWIDVEGEEVFRGMVLTVPKL